VRYWCAAAVASVVCLPGAATAVAASSPDLPPGFLVVRHGPNGGTVWEGRIPNRLRADPRLADVYLPPGYTADRRYPVIYFLHGFWGSPSSFVDGLRLADAADTEITAGRARPFIGVMPPGGPMTKTTSDEWAGVWETYVIRDVVPWVDANLSADPAQRSIAGLSAGGYGAVDIGLRHPGMFKTLESWGGYFQPFRDGPFARATGAYIAARTPTLLARQKAALLRRRELRFFLSTGTSGHGDVKARWTFEFASELSQLKLAHELWVLPAKDRGHLFRRGLPAAIDYAVPG
jgi:enterochelin esterase-like enzyme